MRLTPAERLANEQIQIQRSNRAQRWQRYVCLRMPGSKETENRMAPVTSIFHLRSTQSRTQTLCCLTRMLDEIIGSGRIRFLDGLDWSFEIQCETTGSKCSQGKWRNPRHASDFQLCSLYSDGSWKFNGNISGKPWSTWKKCLWFSITGEFRDIRKVSNGSIALYPFVTNSSLAIKLAN